VARLIDVARAAGVSRSTASNVFNNPEMVRPKLRKRVEAAARDLGYLGPDPKGRALRAGKFNVIAVSPPSNWGVAQALRNPVFAQFISGVGEACDEVGATFVIVPDRNANHGARNALVDGFVFWRIENLSEIEAVRMRRLPFVVMDFDPGPGMGSVRIDARAGCHAAARHLIGLGHRRFAILSFLRGSGAARLHPPGQPRGPEAAGYPIDHEKYLGYADALAEAGLRIDDVPMVQADPVDPTAAAIALDAAPGATAILSMTVMQGLAVLNEAGRRGIAVPRDLSVVGFNNIPDAGRATPPLTTVDALMTARGRAAARMLFTGEAPRHVVMVPELIVRGSTGPAPGA
jgi:DNA-binding LacI/PurR family transcriptional regulator